MASTQTGSLNVLLSTRNHVCKRGPSATRDFFKHQPSKVAQFCCDVKLWVGKLESGLFVGTLQEISVDQFFKSWRTNAKDLVFGVYPRMWRSCSLQETQERVTEHLLVRGTISYTMLCSVVMETRHLGQQRSYSL